MSKHKRTEKPAEETVQEPVVVAEQPKEEKDEVVRVTVPQTNVTVHLDRDPNDPRNRPETKALPSLDD